MISLVLEQSSVDGVSAYLERVKQRVLAGVRVGMQESMQELAGETVAQMGVAGIVSRTGELVATIQSSPKVTETPEILRGTVSADVQNSIWGGKVKHFGIWFEEGTHVKAVKGNLYGFTAAGGKTVFTRGHKAFDVRPHPILNPALEQMRAAIFANLQKHMDEAIAG